MLGRRRKRRQWAACIRGRAYRAPAKAAGHGESQKWPPPTMAQSRTRTYSAVVLAKAGRRGSRSRIGRTSHPVGREVQEGLSPCHGRRRRRLDKGRHWSSAHPTARCRQARAPQTRTHAPPRAGGWTHGRRGGGDTSRPFKSVGKGEGGAKDAASPRGRAWALPAGIPVQHLGAVDAVVPSGASAPGGGGGAAGASRTARERGARSRP